MRNALAHVSFSSVEPTHTWMATSLKSNLEGMSFMINVASLTFDCDRVSFVLADYMCRAIFIWRSFDLHINCLWLSGAALLECLYRIAFRRHHARNSKYFPLYAWMYGHMVSLFSERMFWCVIFRIKRLYKNKFYFSRWKRASYVRPITRIEIKWWKCSASKANVVRRRQTRTHRMKPENLYIAFDMNCMHISQKDRKSRAILGLLQQSQLPWFTHIKFKHDTNQRTTNEMQFHVKRLSTSECIEFKYIC